MEEIGIFATVGLSATVFVGKTGTFSAVEKTGIFAAVVEKIGTFAVVEKIGIFAAAEKIGTFSAAEKTGTFSAAEKTGIFVATGLTETVVAAKTGIVAGAEEAEISFADRTIDFLFNVFFNLYEIKGTGVAIYKSKQIATSVPLDFIGKQMNRTLCWN